MIVYINNRFWRQFLILFIGFIVVTVILVFLSQNFSTGNSSFDTILFMLLFSILILAAYSYRKVITKGFSEKAQISFTETGMVVAYLLRESMPSTTKRYDWKNLDSFQIYLKDYVVFLYLIVKGKKKLIRIIEEQEQDSKGLQDHYLQNSRFCSEFLHGVKKYNNTVGRINNHIIVAYSGFLSTRLAKLIIVLTLLLVGISIYLHFRNQNTSIAFFIIGVSGIIGVILSAIGERKEYREISRFLDS